MKLIHISDLHLGKRLHAFSLQEDQEYILKEIVRITEEKKADAVLISGDVYDKVYPSAQAVSLFDSFLVQLAERTKAIFIISGNHDSPERIAFLGRLTRKAGVYLSPVYDGTISKITLEDEYGPVNVWLLPYLRPSQVRHFYPEATIENPTQALRVALGENPPDPEVRNILMAHQFVTGARTSESEEIQVGGLDQVDASIFDGFDYVALGHLHRPQKIGREGLRYCGTPLPYSVSESEDEKSLAFIELKEKGQLEITLTPLVGLRRIRRLSGTFADLMEEGRKGEGTQDYVDIRLLDEEDVPDAFSRLSLVYPYLLHLEYDNTRTRSRQEVAVTEGRMELSPQSLTAEFYEIMNNQPLSQQQLDYLEKIIADVWKGETE